MNNLDLDKEYIDFIKETVSSVFKDVEIYIFGSRAQGVSLKYSDVDIALIGEGKLDIAGILELKAKFRNSTFPYKVDIVDFNSLDDKFRAIIQNDMLKI